jgi:SAM-dependent methyltransferase
MNEIVWRKVKRFPSTNSGYTDERTCPVCSFPYYEIIFVIASFQFYIDKKHESSQTDYRVVQCSNCQALYMNPSYNPKGFERLFALAGMSYGFHNPKRLDLIVDDLEKNDCLNPSSVVLDVGCGTGDLLHRLPPNLTKIGLDIDAFSIEKAVKNYGNEIEFICLDLNNVTQHALPVAPDTILMFHVLEHLTNPFNVLTFLRNVSKPLTTLVIEVPVLENSTTNDINGFFSVQHLTHFSETSLRNLLAITGWALCRTEHQSDYRGYRVYAKPTTPTAVISMENNDKQMTYDYLEHFYKNLRLINGKIHDILNTSPMKKRLVIWGAGLHTEFLYHFTDLFNETSDMMFCLIDSDMQKINSMWRTIKIYHSTLLPAFNWDNTLLLLSSYGAQFAMLKEALGQGVPSRNIIQLYDSIYVY